MKTPNIYRYLILFAMLYLMCDLASNVLVYRMIQAGPFQISAGTIIFVFTYLFGDVIAEVYGFHYARCVIWYDLFCSAIFSVFSVLTIKLPHPAYWHHSKSFHFIFGGLTTITLGCILAALFSEILNIAILSKLKVLTRGRYFWLRSMTSSSISQLILILACFPLYYYHMYSLVGIDKLMITAYVFYLLVTAVFAYPLTLITNYIKMKTGLDSMDIGISYNPFRLSESAKIKKHD